MCGPDGAEAGQAVDPPPLTEATSVASGQILTVSWVSTSVMARDVALTSIVSWPPRTSSR